jgi:hypothetical protein
MFYNLKTIENLLALNAECLILILQNELFKYGEGADIKPVIKKLSDKLIEIMED